MEIELTGSEQSKRRLALNGLALLLLVLLGAFGASLTRLDAAGYPQPLTWTEWQVLRLERAYQQELNALRREAHLLAELLGQAPDPARAQVHASRLARNYAAGVPALAPARQAVLNAALAVQDWAAGVRPQAEAHLALERAVLLLAGAGQ